MVVVSSIPINLRENMPPEEIADRLLVEFVKESEREAAKAKRRGDTEDARAALAVADRLGDYIELGSDADDGGVDAPAGRDPDAEARACIIEGARVLKSGAADVGEDGVLFERAAVELQRRLDE